MGAQVGILSLAQLQLHDHYNDNSGGIINVLARTASATQKINNLAARQTTSPAWVMVKSILILENSPGAPAGGMDIDWLLSCAGGGVAHSQVRVYRAGIAVFTGADLSTAGVATPETEANIILDLEVNDLVEIWGYHSVGGAGKVCQVDTEHVCYTGTIISLSRRALQTALQTTPAADILYQILV
jgi:hypothetical protein